MGTNQQPGGATSNTVLLVLKSSLQWNSSMEQFNGTWLVGSKVLQPGMGDEQEALGEY